MKTYTVTATFDLEFEDSRWPGEAEEKVVGMLEDNGATNVGVTISFT